jgi:tetratricopeptide (TPR) repeat protein
VLLGDELQSESDFAGSADAYREAVRIDPGSVAAWDGLGQALYALRCFDESVAAFDRALALRPRDPWLHNNIGVALRENGSLSNALDHFHVAHQLAPDMYEPAYNLAVTYQALGLSAEAHAWSERAAALRRPAS